MNPEALDRILQTLASTLKPENMNAGPLSNPDKTLRPTLYSLRVQGSGFLLALLGLASALQHTRKEVR